MMFGFTKCTCCDCGIVFGLDPDWEKALREKKKTFYCPNGHSLAFVGDTEADKLRRERDLLKQQISERDDRIKALGEKRDDALRQISAAKGQITKLKKRAKAGTCPCCKRTFKELAAHMATCHKDFDPTVVDFDAAKAKRA